MSLAGFIALEVWSKPSRPTHRSSLHKSEWNCQYSKPDILCPKTLYSNAYLSENKMCGKAKIMKQ